MVTSSTYENDLFSSAVTELARHVHMNEHTNPHTLRTMIRSEFTANVLLSSTRIANVPAWQRPAPVRAVRTVKQGFIARLFALIK